MLACVHLQLDSTLFHVLATLSFVSQLHKLKDSCKFYAASAAGKEDS